MAGGVEFVAGFVDRQACTCVGAASWKRTLPALMSKKAIRPAVPPPAPTSPFAVEQTSCSVGPSVGVGRKSTNFDLPACQSKASTRPERRGGRCCRSALCRRRKASRIRGEGERANPADRVAALLRVPGVHARGVELCEALAVGDVPDADAAGLVAGGYEAAASPEKQTA